MRFVKYERVANSASPERGTNSRHADAQQTESSVRSIVKVQTQQVPSFVEEYCSFKSFSPRAKRSAALLTDAKISESIGN
jgi:hypothetical protein